MQAGKAFNEFDHPPCAWARPCVAAMERQGAGTGRAVQRRTARAARGEPRGRPAGHEPAARRAAPCTRGSTTTPRSCSPPTAPAPRNWRAAAASCRRPNGCSTTTTSSKSRSARSATICRRASTASCPSSPTGPFAGYPRVFGIAWAFVAHTDSRFDPRDAAALRARLPARAAADDRRAVGGGDHAAHRAGREPAPRWREQIVGSRAARQEADALADRLLGVGRRAVGARCADICRALERQPLVRALRRAARASACATRIRASTPALALARRAAAPRRARRPTRSCSDEHQRQGASNVTVRNIITSMRLISDVDWAEFFESVSLVDDALRAASDFAAMDFADAQSLPQRDRGAGARLDAVGARDRATARCDARAARGRARATRARASGDPGLSPDRRGPPRVRARDRLSRRRCATGISRFNVGARHRRLRRRDLVARRGCCWRWRCGRCRRPGVDGWRCWLLASARRRFRRSRCADGAGQSRGHARLRRDDAAGPGAARRACRRAAHAGRRADAADHAKRAAGADRAARGPLPRRAGRRSALRAAVRLASTRDRDDRRRRRSCSPSPPTASRG